MAKENSLAWRCRQCGATHRADWRATFAKAAYVGGHSQLKHPWEGTLFVSTSAIGIAISDAPISMRKEVPIDTAPKRAVIPMEDVASVEILGDQVAKSKVAAVLAFGVIGGLAAKNSKHQTAIVVRTKGGETAYYSIDKQESLRARAKLTPILRMVGIPLVGEPETTAESPTPEPSDLASQLRELASLRDEGILTDDEFDIQKANLLGQ